MTLAALTGADVAASDDIRATKISVGIGNWSTRLEPSKRICRSMKDAQERWTHVLAAPVATDDSADYALNSVLAFEPAAATGDG